MRPQRIASHSRRRSRRTLRTGQRRRVGGLRHFGGQMKTPPYFPFYPLDFSGDPRVESMSTLAVGAYTLLLCKAWYETPAGSIPDDDRLLAKWARVSVATWSRIKDEVLAAFTLRDGRWSQKRMSKEFKKAVGLIQQRSDAGRASGESRRKPESTSVEHPLNERAVPVAVSFEQSGNGASISGSDSGSSGVLSSGGAGGFPPMPPSLAATPAFVSAWVAYTAVRAEKGHPPMGPSEMQAAWARLLGWGPSIATLAVERAAANGWKNIREPEHGHTNGTSGGAPNGRGASAKDRHIAREQERLGGMYPDTGGELPR